MADKLYDELIAEVLVRLPLEDPKSLLCAALVCKKWGAIVCGPGFRSQFRKFHHHGPPMLGFISTAGEDDDVINEESVGEDDGIDVEESGNEDGGESDDKESIDEDGDSEDDADVSVVCRFISTSTFRHVPRVSAIGWYAIDSNHGRVLLYPLRKLSAPFENILSVWCPITGLGIKLPRVRRCPYPDIWSAALVCAADAEAGSVGVCDHLDGCHRKPFLVILVGTDKDGTFSCIYSSADGAWGEPTSAQIPPFREWLKTVPAARVGNALHFTFEGSASILRYDVAARGVSVIERPLQCSDNFQGSAVLMSMDDGMLGFAAVHGHRLRLWAREVSADGLTTWVQRKVIKLKTHGNELPYLTAYSVGVFFVWTAGVGLSLVNLRSNKVTNVETDDGLFGVVPYVTYCIPALRGEVFGIQGDGRNAGA